MHAMNMLRSTQTEPTRVSHSTLHPAPQIETTPQPTPETPQVRRKRFEQQQQQEQSRAGSFSSTPPPGASRFDDQHGAAAVRAGAAAVAGGGARKEPEPVLVLPAESCASTGPEEQQGCGAPATRSGTGAGFSCSVPRARRGFQERRRRLEFGD